MPAPLPPDQLTIVRSLLAKGDTAGAIKVYMEATGATQAEAKTEVDNLAARYGLVGTQLPDIFMRRTPAPPKPGPPAETPAAPAPVAQQAANVPLEPIAPAPAPVPPPPPAPAPAPIPKAAAPQSVRARATASFDFYTSTRNFDFCPKRQEVSLGLQFGGPVRGGGNRRCLVDTRVDAI